jgi:hypothetical protein
MIPWLATMHCAGPSFHVRVTELPLSFSLSLTLSLCHVFNCASIDFPSCIFGPVYLVPLLLLLLRKLHGPL